WRTHSGYRCANKPTTRGRDGRLRTKNHTTPARRARAATLISPVFPSPKSVRAHRLLIFCASPLLIRRSYSERAVFSVRDDKLVWRLVFNVTLNQNSVGDRSLLREYGNGCGANF